jgi:YopX protein.
MTNDLKFREWRNGNMCFWHDIKSLHMLALNDGQGIFEQCTGITDMNGVEIYEGDIVQPVRVTGLFPADDLAVKPIVVKRGNYVHGAWVARDVAKTSFSVSDYYFGGDVRVIGNIHVRKRIHVSANMAEVMTTLINDTDVTNANQFAKQVDDTGVGFTSIEVGDISYDEVKDYYHGQVELVIRDKTQQ